MISRESYMEMKKHFGYVSSWAVWSQPDPNEGPKSGIGDLSCFADEDALLEMLNPDYVFVGFNGAAHGGVESGPRVPDISGNIPCWANFHSSDRIRCRDYKIRHALAGTEFYGSYITDIIKEYIDTDPAGALKYISSHPDFLNKNIENFQKELDILGTDPAIIAFGEHAYKVLKKYFKGRRLIKAMHYAHYIGMEDYREKLLSQLSVLRKA